VDESWSDGTSHHGVVVCLNDFEAHDTKRTCLFSTRLEVRVPIAQSHRSVLAGAIWNDSTLDSSVSEGRSNGQGKCSNNHGKCSKSQDNRNLDGRVRTIVFRRRGR
jgi:hypothetical protein